MFKDKLIVGFNLFVHVWIQLAWVRLNSPWCRGGHIHKLSQCSESASGYAQVVIGVLLMTILWDGSLHGCIKDLCFAFFTQSFQPPLEICLRFMSMFVCPPVFSHLPIPFPAHWSQWQDGRVHEHPGSIISQCRPNAHTAETPRHTAGCFLSFLSCFLF